MARLFAAFTVLLAGCAIAGHALAAQQASEEMLFGKWVANVEKTKEFFEANSLDLGDEAFLKELAKLTVEFRADHSIIVRTGNQERESGQWKYVKEEDGQVFLELIRDGESTPATVELLDSNTIAVTPKFEKPLVLSRGGQSAVTGVVGKLIGAWKCDKNATLELASNRNFSQGQIDDMMAEAGGMVVRFEADGSFSATTISEGEVRELKGTWTSSGVDEDKQAFQLALKAERGPDSLEVEIRADGSIRFSPPDEPSAVFVRSPEKSQETP